MKRIIILLVLIFVNCLMYSQKIFQFKDGNIQTIVEKLEKENTKSVSFENKKVDNKSFYKIIAENSDSYELENTTNHTKIVVSKSELIEKSEIVTSRWNFGIVTLPMKIRFGGGNDENKSRRYFDLSSDFNLGLAISYKLNNKNYTSEMQMHWLLSFGTSQVKLTSESTNQFISQDLSSVAFSPTTGIIFQFNSKIQIITIVGFDIVPGKIGNEWLYKDKPFFGVGIGFKAFEIGKASETP